MPKEQVERSLHSRRLRQNDKCMMSMPGNLSAIHYTRSRCNRKNEQQHSHQKFGSVLYILQYLKFGYQDCYHKFVRFHRSIHIQNQSMCSIYL